MGAVCGGDYARAGERNGKAKLRPELVRDIRARVALGERHATIARYYGISRSAITAIRRGQCWGWLE